MRYLFSKINSIFDYRIWENWFHITIYFLPPKYFFVINALNNYSKKTRIGIFIHHFPFRTKQEQLGTWPLVDPLQGEYIGK